MRSAGRSRSAVQLYSPWLLSQSSNKVSPHNPGYSQNFTASFHLFKTMDSPPMGKLPLELVEDHWHSGRKKPRRTHWFAKHEGLCAKCRIPPGMAFHRNVGFNKWFSEDSKVKKLSLNLASIMFDGHGKDGLLLPNSVELLSSFKNVRELDLRAVRLRRIPDFTSLKTVSVP